MKTVCHRAHRSQGSFRIILFLVIAMGACLWMGGQGVYTGLKNRRPVTLACSDLANGKPTAHWLVLTNCELQVAGSAYLIRKSKYQSSASGRITEAYVPVYSPGQTEQDRCYAVLATKDERLLALLEEMRQANSEKEAEQFMVKHGHELQVRRDVEGLVRFGIEEQNGEKSKLAGLRGNLAPDFILLSEGQKPNLGGSLGLVLLGLVIGGGIWCFLRVNKAESTADLH